MKTSATSILRRLQGKHSVSASGACSLVLLFLPIARTCFTEVANHPPSRRELALVDCTECRPPTLAPLEQLPPLSIAAAASPAKKVGRHRPRWKVQFRYVRTDAQGASITPLGISTSGPRPSLTADWGDIRDG